jgi:hypothetical protein
VTRRSLPAALATGLAVYGTLAAFAASAHRDWLNPDAVSYLRNALYWTEGRFTDAVAGYWSPLLSLCVAPLVAWGRDPVHAGVLVTAVWGAVLVAASAWLVERLQLLPAGLAVAASVIVGEATVRWGTTLFPDVILAACLMGSACLLVAPDPRRWVAFLAGAVGALGYLGKAYGFPFFLVFLPLTLAALHGRRSWRPVARRWAWAMCGFAVVAGPWVLALSIKYGRPTIGLVGKINHAIVGPRDPARDALWRPVPGRVTVWEIPETRDYGYWSPLESAETLGWQVRLAWRHAKRIRAALAGFDWLGLGLAFTVLGPFAALALGDGGLLRSALWIAGTFAVFGAGFLFVYFDYRYTGPFLKPLAIMGTLALADRLGRRAAAAWASPAARWARPALLAIVLGSFAAHANVPFIPYLVQEPGGTAFDNITVDAAPHKALARRLRDAGLSGPVASNFYWGGMFTAYWMDAAFVGAPAGKEAADVRAELDAVGARVFLVDPAWPLAAALADDATWSLAFATETAGQPIDVYARP